MKDLIDHVKRECTEIDREARYDQMLDECYSFECVGGPFEHMQPSQVLKEMDPTAYRGGVNDYMDGEDTYEIDGKTYDRKEVEEARDGFVEELEDHLSDLEDDSEDADHATIDEHNRLEGERDAVIDQIEAAKNYQF